MYCTCIAVTIYINIIYIILTLKLYYSGTKIITTYRVSKYKVGIINDTNPMNAGPLKTLVLPTHALTGIS